MLINSWRHYRRGFQPAGKIMDMFQPNLIEPQARSAVYSFIVP